MVAPFGTAGKSTTSKLVIAAGAALCAGILLLASASETSARFGGFGGMGGFRGGGLGGLGGMRGGLGGMRGGLGGMRSGVGGMRGGLGASGMRSGLGGRGISRAGALRGGSSSVSRSGVRHPGASTASRRAPSKYTAASATSKHAGADNSSRITRPTDRMHRPSQPTKPVASGPGTPSMPGKPIAPGPGKPIMPGQSGPALAGSSAAHRPSQTASAASRSTWTGCHGSGGVWGHNGSCGSPSMPTGVGSWGSSSLGRFLPTSWRIPMVSWDWSGLFSQDVGGMSLAGIAAPFAAVPDPVAAPSPERRLQPALAKSKLKDSEQGFLAIPLADWLFGASGLLEVAVCTLTERCSHQPASNSELKSVAIEKPPPRPFEPLIIPDDLQPAADPQPQTQPTPEPVIDRAGRTVASGRLRPHDGDAATVALSERAVWTRSRSAAGPFARLEHQYVDVVAADERARSTIAAKPGTGAAADTGRATSPCITANARIRSAARTRIATGAGRATNTRRAADTDQHRRNVAADDDNAGDAAFTDTGRSRSVDRGRWSEPRRAASTRGHSEPRRLAGWRTRSSGRGAGGRTERGSRACTCARAGSGPCAGRGGSNGPDRYSRSADRDLSDVGAERRPAHTDRARARNCAGPGTDNWDGRR